MTMKKVLLRKKLSRFNVLKYVLKLQPRVLGTCAEFSCY